MRPNVAQVPRGQTLRGIAGTIDTSDYGTSIYQEGFLRTFPDADYTTSPPTFRSGGEVEARFVRNVSGQTLYAGYIAVWKTGYKHRRISALCGTVNEACAGVIDDALVSSGVRNGDCFWLITKGPVLCKTSPSADGTNVISEHDVLYAMTATNTTAITTAGRPYAAATTATSTATTDGKVFLVYQNSIGRAMSAKTTANTNVNVLVDLDLY